MQPASRRWRSSTSVLARQQWRDRDPVAERVALEFRGQTYEVEIVGVVGAVRPRGFDSRPRPELFLPHAQLPNGEDISRSNQW